MDYVYLSGDWHNPNSTSSTSEILQKNGIKLYNWKIFYKMDMKNNAITAIDAIKGCSHYAAILDNPNHHYPGTFELMAIAIALEKPVSVFIPSNRNPGKYKGDRHHEFRTEFDRFWLYHPNVSIFVGKDEYNNFIESIKNERNECP